MTEMLDTTLIASHRTRRNIVICSLLFTWALIVVIVCYGSPTNSLHTSALAWAFVSNIGVLFAYSFGTVLTNYLQK